MSGGPMKVAITILNWNKRDDLVACLNSVFRQDHSPFEVVLVDNGSSDGSVEAVMREFPAVHVIQNESNLGVPAGRNIGFQYVRENLPCQYVLQLDNDTILEKNFLRYLVESLEKDPKAGIAYGKAYTQFPSKTIMSVGASVNFYTGFIGDIGAGEIDKGQFDSTRYVAACDGFGCLIRRAALDKIGGINEAFAPYGWDDVEFCFRARELGYRIAYVPSAIIYHKGTKQGRSPIPAYEQSKVKNYFHLLRHYANPLQKLCSLVYIPLWAIFLVGRMMVRGRLNIVIAQIKGFFVSTQKQPRIETARKRELR